MSSSRGQRRKEPPDSEENNLSSAAKLATTHREATALLAVLGVGTDAGADAKRRDDTIVDECAATGSAVGVGVAAAGNELPAGAIAHVLGTGGIRGQTAGHDGTTGSATGGTTPLVAIVAIVTATVSAVACLVTIATSTGSGTGSSTSSSAAEAAPLLASLVLGAHTGTHADGLTSPGKGSTAPRCAVSHRETLSTDELDSLAVTDVLLARWVGEVLAEGEVWVGVDR